MSQFDIDASRALKPYFYTAPAPEGKVPMPYQHAGVEYHLARDHALFGDAPGLGKTIECILLGNAIGARRTLVVCPASLRLNWEIEIWKWSTIPNVTTYPVLKAKDGISNQHHYVIISYALLANKAIHAAIMAERWDHLILDEAHALKDPKGNTRTKAIGHDQLGIKNVCGRITMASGTILPNQPVEVYNAARMLNWGAIDCWSLETFRENYYDLGGGMVRSPREVHLPNGQTVMRSELHWSETVRRGSVHLDSRASSALSYWLITGSL